MQVHSSRLTTVASTFSRGSPGRASGRAFEVPFAHVWGLSGGMPSSFRGYYDTAPILAALGQHAAELRFVSDLAPPGVIAVLLATPRIAAGRLDVAVGTGTDPHVGVCRRNR